MEPKDMMDAVTTSMPDRTADEQLDFATRFAQATHWVHLAGGTPVAEVVSLEPLIAAAYDQNG